VIAPVGTRPPQQMREVLLISTGSLSSHRFASSIDGSSAPCFNSTLFGDIMAAAWVQENARWHGFPSSQFGQLNSLKRNTLETAFSFFKLPLKLSDQRRKSKSRVPEETGGELPPGPPGLVGPGRPVHPGPRVGSVRFSMYPVYFTFSAHEKMLAWYNFARNSRKIKEKLFTKNPHLVLRPRLDVQALLP
jgi:hypothetical protein